MAPPDPIPSASLILLRDAPEGPEVFMIRRNAGLRFAAGATVFPGGRVDPEDRALHGWTPPGVPAADLPLRLAAIREAFEECGILLAREPLDGARLAALRAPSLLDFGQRLRAAGVRPDTDALVPFARWITPETVWRRFDATFYLALAPAGQEAVVDGGEAVEGLWATPRTILEADEAGRLSLVFATRMNLTRLAACRTAAEALEAAARHQPLVPILPHFADTSAGPVLRIPEGAGYTPTEVAADLVRLG